MTGFIYPRTIEVRRPRSNVEDTDPATPATGLIVGNVGYSAQTGVVTAGDPSGEDVIATGLSASIEFRAPMSRSENAVPTDTRGPNAWVIMIPVGQASALVQNRDVIVDLDEQKRFQVIAVRHGLLGQHIRAEELDM